MCALLTVVNAFYCYPFFPHLLSDVGGIKSKRSVRADFEHYEFQSNRQVEGRNFCGLHLHLRVGHEMLRYFGSKERLGKCAYHITAVPLI